MIKYKPEFILKYKSYISEPALDIKLYNIIVPNGPGLAGLPKKNNYQRKITDEKWTKGHHVHIPIPPTEVIVSGPNAWKAHQDKNQKDDSKLIIGILNKINKANFDKMIQETVALNYKNEKIIDIIFTKSVSISKPLIGLSTSSSNEDYSELYAEYCKKLELDDLINELCLEQFIRKKNKNLCKFIGSLYNIDLIKSVEPFIKMLNLDLNSDNLEMLLELIKTVGPKKQEFKELIANLDLIKDQFNRRLKFAIMDIIEAAL